MVASAVKMTQRVAALAYILVLGVAMQSVQGAPFIVETNSLRVKTTGQVYDTAMAAVSSHWLGSVFPQPPQSLS